MKPRTRPRKRPAPVYWDWFNDAVGLTLAAFIVYGLTLVTLNLISRL